MRLGTSRELENAGSFKSMEPHRRDSEEALEAVWGRGQVAIRSMVFRDGSEHRGENGPEGVQCGSQEFR